MSGHSKWSTIKHKKARADAARGKVFTKLIKEITVAARMGGSDPETNPRLRTAITAAKGANMPQDNITRAIKKGAGELEGVHYEEITYEGYGPGGVAVLLQTLTDNKNRTAAEVRHAFTKHEGKLAGPGEVAWMFENKGIIVIEGGGLDEEELMMEALDAGAEDFISLGDDYQVVTAMADFNTVQLALKDKPVISAGLEFVPKNTIQVDEGHASRLLRLMEMLEDLDDTQKLTANFDIDDSILEKLAE